MNSELDAIDTFFYDNTDINNDLLNNWGNNPHFKPPHSVRLAFQNVRGIGSVSEPASEIFDVMAEYNIDIFGCAETNVNWTINLKDRATAAMKLRFGSGQLIAASTTGSREGYLQGGVALLVTGKSTTRIVKRGTDSLGRFAWVRMTTPGGRGILIVTAYRVCQKKRHTCRSKNSLYATSTCAYCRRRHHP